MSDRSLYQQIADVIRQRIASGDLDQGEQIPSERDLMASHQASRGTVRQAVLILKAEGLIEVRHGRGAYVRSSAPLAQPSSYDTYDRKVLVDVLVYHWRTKTSGCGCGWEVLGASHPEHVADVYEESVRSKL